MAQWIKCIIPSLITSGKFPQAGTQDINISEMHTYDMACAFPQTHTEHPQTADKRELKIFNSC